MSPEEQRVLLEEMGLWPLWRDKAALSPAVLAHPSPVVGERAATVNDDSLMGSSEDRLAHWSALEEQVKRCQCCVLHKNRLKAVLGEGDKTASWLFIGEGPGREEDQQGRPFVGRAGQLLNAMLAAMGMSRESVYIANAVKCRPPNNRTPFLEEMKACFPFLQTQIRLLAPKVIVLLGKSAAMSVLGLGMDTRLSLGTFRQKVHYYNQTPVIVTYHPAYLLRQPTEKRKAWEDLLFAQQVYAEHVS